jgi:iron complex transport system ATP-binding protein
MHPTEIAQQMASIEQEIHCAFELTVREAVALGRLPHLRRLASISQKDHSVIENAMHETGITPLANRSVLTLSSGERQRVWIAMALAQEPEVLLLDEPTSHLDIKYQMEIMELVRGMADRGLTVILSAHDLNLAAHYSDRIALLANRELLMFGKPCEVLTEALIERAFGAKMQIVKGHQGELFLLPQLKETSQLQSVLKEV